MGERGVRKGCSPSTQLKSITNFEVRSNLYILHDKSQRAIVILIHNKLKQKYYFSICRSFTIPSVPVIEDKAVINVWQFAVSISTRARIATMRTLVFLVLVELEQASSRFPFVISFFANSLSARVSGVRMAPRWSTILSKFS